MSAPKPSRRQFLQTTGTAAATASVLSSVQAVHAAGEGTIRLAIVGCGGRGTGGSRFGDVSGRQGGAQR